MALNDPPQTIRDLHLLLGEGWKIERPCRFFRDNWVFLHDSGTQFEFSPDFDLSGWFLDDLMGLTVQAIVKAANEAKEQGEKEIEICCSRTITEQGARVDSSYLPIRHRRS